MRVVFVVPTYNEADNLRPLAERMLEVRPEVEVLIVDDASPDGTGAIGDQIAAAEPRFHVMHRSGPRGYAPASREGLKWALSRGFEFIGTMDADLSHDPGTIPALIRALEGGADLSIGSRYVPGGELVVEWGRFRRAVSRSGSSYARMMIGTSTRDCTSGFRCYRAEVLGRVPLDAIKSDGYSFLIETLAFLTDEGAVVAEVPIRYVDRRAGASKISKRIIFEAFGRTTGLGLSRLFGHRHRTRRTQPARG